MVYYIEFCRTALFRNRNFEIAAEYGVLRHDLIMNFLRHHKKQFASFLFILIAAFVIWFFAPIQNAFQILLDAAADSIHQYPFGGMIVFFVLSTLSAMFTFFSTVLLVPVAAFIWGDITTFFLLLGAWFLGGIATYWIGSRFGRSVAARCISQKKIMHYEDLISRRVGFFIVVLLKLSLASEVPGYILGIARYNFWKYALATALAEAALAFFAVSVSTVFLAKNYFLFLGALFGGLIIVSVFITLVHKKKR